MNGRNSGTDGTAERSPGDQRVDELEDDLAEAVERSYAMRLADVADLSDEERKRIREKSRGANPGSRQPD
jgi:hypothetical protein